MAAAESCRLQANTGVLDPRHNTVGADADEGDHSGAPSSHFGFETLAAGTKFVVGQFIGKGGAQVDDVRDAD